MLSDETFVSDFQPTKPDEPLNYPLTEFEPVFDAADFMRCGRDIFYQRSFVTNQFGVDWLQQHLGDTYRFHEIESGCRTPIHIDTTFVPLAPGKALCNPKFVKKLPPILDKWDILWAPEPVPRTDFEPPFRFDSLWLSMNVFSIDEERVFVDSLQEGLIAKLKDWGFTPIPVPFQRYYPFGGGLHCSTLDVRRQGDLKSYF
jgi:glycine amidinotransferase